MSDKVIGCFAVLFRLCRDPSSLQRRLGCLSRQRAGENKPGRDYPLSCSMPGGSAVGIAVKGVTRAVEDYSYQVMDAQTANNRVGPGSNKSK
jgi:hypothetical protein